MIGTYRQKTTLAEAVKYDGTNIGEVLEITGGSVGRIDENGSESHVLPRYKVHTMNGDITLHKGDYVVRINNHTMVIRPRLFNILYEKI